MSPWIDFGSIRPEWCVLGRNTGLGVLPNSQSLYGRSGRVLDRRVRGDEPEVQRIRGQRRISKPCVLEARLHQRWKTHRLCTGAGRIQRRHRKTGPANWELGTFPEDREITPVSGICWYEAAAFAEWAGKSLPTVFHWFKAADHGRSAEILAAEQFRRSPDSRARREHRGLSRCGAFDMGGERARVVLQRSRRKAFHTGGAWSGSRVHVPPTGRRIRVRPVAPTKRLPMRRKYLTSDPSLAKAQEPVPLRPPTGLFQGKTGLRCVFRIYEGLYSYDKVDLDPEIVVTDESPKYWIKQKIYYNSAQKASACSPIFSLPKGIFRLLTRRLSIPGSRGV